MSHASLRLTVAFTRALSDQTGGQPKVFRRDYLSEGPLPVIDQGAAPVAGYTNDERAAYGGPLPVLLFGDHTRLFKYVDVPFALGADGVKVLQPAPWYEPKFLYYYLLTQDIPGRGYSRHFKFLKQVSFPFLPRSEQRRIVEILDQADRLRRLRAEADAKTDRILPALFTKMFGEPLTNPKGWTVKPLGELAVHLTSGSRGWARYTGRGCALFLRTQDILDGEIAAGLLSVDPPQGAEAERTRLQDGDVAVTITGIVGKAATFRANDRDVYVSQHIALVRPNPRQLHPDFLTSYANLPLGKVPVLARFQYGQTKPGLGFRELTTSLIPVPPINLQIKLAARLDALRAIRVASSCAETRIDSLWQILQMRAFAGDLTASWRETHMNELLHEMEHQAKALAEVQ